MKFPNKTDVSNFLKRELKNRAVLRGMSTLPEQASVNKASAKRVKIKTQKNAPGKPQ